MYLPHYLLHQGTLLPLIPCTNWCQPKQAHICPIKSASAADVSPTLIVFHASIFRGIYFSLSLSLLSSREKKEGTREKVREREREKSFLLPPRCLLTCWRSHVSSSSSSSFLSCLWSVLFFCPSQENELRRQMLLGINLFIVGLHHHGLLVV